MKPRARHFIVFTFFVVLFLFPYLAALREFSSLQLDFSYLGRVYAFAAVQAALSAFGTLVAGCYAALGLFWLRSRVRPAAYAAWEFVFMLPSLLPALFVVISFLNMFFFFPFGLPGVIILHVASEVGLAAVIIQRIYQQRFSPYMDWAQLAGASWFYFLRKNFRLVAPDLAPVLAIFFVFFLTSISIPLMIGGGGYTSLELAIYEKIMVARDWNQAVNLFLCQFAFIALVIGLLHMVPQWAWAGAEKTNSRLLNHRAGLIPLAIPVFVILCGMLNKLPRGLLFLSRQPEVMEGWYRYLMGSLLVGFLTGALVFIALSLMGYFLQIRQLRKFFTAFLTPSFIILAFAFLIFPGESSSANFMKISWALMIAFLPTLLRLGVLQRIAGLDDQVEAGVFMGASSTMIFRKVVWPQTLPMISLMSGLASVWAMGDFALSRVISGRDLTMAMWVQSLVDQYRWDMALVLSWMILLASFVVFSFFWGLSYVSRQKLI